MDTTQQGKNDINNNGASDQPPATPLSPTEPQQSQPPADTKKPLIKPAILIAAAVLVIGIVAALLLWKQPPPTTQAVKKTYGKTLKIQSEYWPGVYWVAIADKMGWFKEAGLAVELIDATTDYHQKLQDMVDGKMDENNFTFYDLMQFNAKGADLVAVVNTDVSSGTEGIITDKSYPSLASLKGKKIGTQTDNYLLYILEQALKNNNMSLNDITLVNINPDDAAKELDSKTIDAALTWEPQMSKALEANAQYHKLFDTSEILGANPSVIAFHKSFIDNYPDTVQAFVDVWHKTTQYILGNSSKAVETIADFYKTSANATKQEAESYMRIDKILNLQQNRTAFTHAAGFTSLHGAAQQLNRYMLDRKLIDHEVNSADFLNPQFIRTVKD